MIRASHLQVGSLSNPELHPKILPHLGHSSEVPNPSPASPSLSRTQVSVVFFILTPSPLGPRTWVSGLFVLCDSSPPSRAQETNSSPLQGHRSHKLLAQDPESCHTACSLLLNIRPSSPPALLVRVPSARFYHSLLATSQATSKSTVFQVEFILPVLQSWQGGHGQSAA